MSKGIKSRKLHTNTIYDFRLKSLILVLIIFSLSSSSLKNNKNWVIVIDAGHGGKDSGALGSLGIKTQEKDITLAIALKTGRYIEQNLKNAEVIYTRKNDTFVELRDRANIANKNKADLFISIHANWAKSSGIKGSETYVMGVNKDEQNLEVAMKENEVILMENDHTTKYEGFDPKSEISYVMFSLTQKIYREQSQNLASKIQTEFRERVDRNDRDVKQAGFWVLYTTTMPSVLVETGFITNPSEEKFLKSQEGQNYIASAIFRACKEYINEIDSKSGISWDNSLNPTAKSDSSELLMHKTGKLVFMVQIATSLSKTEIQPENFKGLTDVTEINSQDIFKYASGNFSDYISAVNYRKKLESVFPDAFVIAVKDYKILPLQQALDHNNK